MRRCSGKKNIIHLLALRLQRCPCLLKVCRRYLRAVFTEWLTAVASLTRCLGLPCCRSCGLSCVQTTQRGQQLSSYTQNIRKYQEMGFNNSIYVEFLLVLCKKTYSRDRTAPQHSHMPITVFPLSQCVSLQCLNIYEPDMQPFSSFLLHIIPNRLQMHTTHSSTHICLRVYIPPLPVCVWST